MATFNKDDLVVLTSGEGTQMTVVDYAPDDVVNCMWLEEHGVQCRGSFPEVLLSLAQAL